MRTDANNLVSTAQSTRLPEQKETLHMIQTLRKESMSGSIDDLAHVKTEDMLADCLTKTSAKPDVLVKAVNHGVLPNVDTHPEFRSLLKHKAFLVAWCCQNLNDARDIVSFMDIDIQSTIQSTVQAYFANSSSFLATYIHPCIVGSNRRALHDDDDNQCLHNHDTSANSIQIEIL